MNERLKKLRKTLDLTQQKFAERIGVKQNTVAQYEMGRNIPIDSVISLICREFNVNEDWLRNGTGEMFIERTRDEEITEFIGSIQMTGEDSFKNRLVSVLANLTEEQWELLADMAEKLVKEKD